LGSGPEVGFEEIFVDLLEARFWIVSALPTTHPVNERNDNFSPIDG
jgi:hypothetical protein